MNGTKFVVQNCEPDKTDHQDDLNIGGTQALAALVDVLSDDEEEAEAEAEDNALVKVLASDQGVEPSEASKEEEEEGDWESFCQVVMIGELTEE